MGKQIEFRLTEKRTPASWTLSGGYAVKPGFGSKLINYFPGSDSIYVEDQKSDVKAKEVEFFYNDILSDPATSIMVDENNTSLLNYLKAHAFFGHHYYIHNEDLLAENKLADYDKIEKAFSLIKETDDFKVKAIALVVFKIDAHGWSPTKAKAELKEKATKNPDMIINAIEADGYEARYLAALAFYSGIVKDNNTSTAVVWNDENQSEILKLAVGENGIQKLGEKLSVSNEESNLILQQIGTKLNALNSAPAAENFKVKNAEVVSGKTAEQIAAEAVEAYKASLPKAKTEAEIRAEILAELDGNAPDTAPVDTTAKDTVTFDSTDLVQVQAKYKELFGKDAPINKKNNLDWLNAEIAKGI